MSSNLILNDEIVEKTINNKSFQKKNKKKRIKLKSNKKNPVRMKSKKQLSQKKIQLKNLGVNLKD